MKIFLNSLVTAALFLGLAYFGYDSHVNKGEIKLLKISSVEKDSSIAKQDSLILLNKSVSDAAFRTIVNQGMNITLVQFDSLMQNQLRLEQLGRIKLELDSLRKVVVNNPQDTMATNRMAVLLNILQGK